MRARFRVGPIAGARIRQRDGTRLNITGEIDITERIIRPPVIHERIDRDQWSWGVSSSGDIRLTLADPEGLFTPSTNPRSVFNYAGMKGSTVRITYPRGPTGNPDDRNIEEIIWWGYLTEKNVQHRPRDGVSTILARSPDVALREASFPATAVFDGASIRGILSAIWRRQEIRDFMGRLIFQRIGANNSIAGDPTESGIVVPQVADLFPDGPDFTRALSVVQDILQVTDNIIRIIPTGDLQVIQTRILQRGSLAAVGTLRDIISIDEHSEGTEQLYNRLIVSTGIPAPDHVAQIDDLPSQDKYGLRTTRVNGRWLRNVGNARQIAQSLIRRLARPRRRLVVTTDPWALGNVANMRVGNSVSVAIPAAGGRGSARYASGRYGTGRYQPVRHQAYKGAYWIEQLRWNPDNDTAQLFLRER